MIWPGQREIATSGVTARSRGFLLASWFRHTPERQRAALLGEIAELIAKGKLHAPIHATYDVSEIKEAVAFAARVGRSARSWLSHATDAAHRQLPAPVFGNVS